MRILLAVLAIAWTLPAVAQAQPEPRRIALVYDLRLPPLFIGTGEVAETAGFHVDTFLRRVLTLETDFAETPYALAISGMACDELRLIGTPTAERALQTLRRLVRTRPLLQTTYTDRRLDHMGSREVAGSVSTGSRAIERCARASPRSPLLPPDVSVPSADAAAGLAAAGVTSVLSAYAVPPTEPRPAVAPSIVIGPADDVPDVAIARPEAPALAVVIDADRQAILADLAADDRFEPVEIDALDGLDVVGGVIDPSFDIDEDEARTIRRAEAEIELFTSYTLSDNPLTPVYRAVLARAGSTALWGPTDDGIELARTLVRTLTDAREQIGVGGGTVTFTSRTGEIPITISNAATYPVRVLVELSTAKMTFDPGPSRVVEIAPPGETITFGATALSTGTFPVQVVVSDPTHQVRFDTAQIDVRSAAANLSAVVLTGGGALFLAFLMIRRRRKRA